MYYWIPFAVIILCYNIAVIILCFVIEDFCICIHQRLSSGFLFLECLCLVLVSG